MFLGVGRVFGIVPFPFHLCTYCIHADDGIQAIGFFAFPLCRSPLPVTATSETLKHPAIAHTLLYARYGRPLDRNLLQGFLDDRNHLA